jgi:FtsP/CotA-like multicopper oxidase with cupredoxin domain
MGQFLGPTLRAERGEKVAFDVANDLDEPTSVHWHGMHLPATMDGGPHQTVDPGQTWKPHWTIDQQGLDLVVPPASSWEDRRPRVQGAGRAGHSR